MSKELRYGSAFNEQGSVKYEYKDDYMHIYDLYVHPQFRNQGVAKGLLESAIKNIREYWHDEIQIVCNPTEEGIDKDRLRKLYESYGLKIFEYYG